MTTIVLFRTMIMIALVIMMVGMDVRRPRWKWVGEVLPIGGALGGFGVSKEAGIECGLKRGAIDIERHDRE